MKQMRGATQTSNPYRVKRTRTCSGCGRVYQTVEITRALFEKVVELVRARRDLDALLLDHLEGGELRDVI